MKIVLIICSFALAWITVSANGQVDDKLFSQRIQSFQSMIERDDAESLAKHINYPLRRAYPLKPIKNPTEFIKHYHEIFDANQKSFVLSVSPDTDYKDSIYGKLGWYKSQENTLILKREYIASFVDLDTSGNLISIVLSDTEKKRMDTLFKKTNTDSHNPTTVQIIDTGKFLVKIEKVNNTYRYSSWSDTKDTNKKPDIILNNGTIKFTGGQIDPACEYLFKNGKYTYIIENQMSADINADIIATYLKVYAPNKKQIVSLKGRLIYPEDI